MKTTITITKENVLTEIEKELNKINLCDYVTFQIMQELEDKSFNVQATFYYRMIGLSQEEVANILNVNRFTIIYYIQENMKKIQEILISRTTK